MANSSRSALKTLQSFVETSYDYVVVGGGTAGLAVAARLSEDPNVSVGLLEDSGPIKTTFANWTAPVERDWHEAAIKYGIGWAPPIDAWSGTHLGGFSCLSTIDRDHGSGTRSYAVTGYFLPNAERENLAVLTDALVTRISLNGKEGAVVATGIAFEYNEQEFHVKARKEIILSAGVFQTPQLLELSGIGGGEVLHAAGIACTVMNNDVGESLSDHPTTGISYELIDGVFSLDQLTQEMCMSQALESHAKGEGGPLANSIGNTGFLSLARVATAEEMYRIDARINQSCFKNDNGPSEKERTLLTARLHDPNAANLQLMFIPGSVNLADFDNHTELLAASTAQSRVTVLICLTHPFSRGSVHVVSADAKRQPRIDPQYLQHPVDIEVLSVGLRIVDELFQTAPLKDRVKGRVLPSPDVNIKDPIAQKTYIRQHCGTEYHPIGTAALGKVVDRDLKVIGVENLRVADASIFPLHLSGNIMTPVYAVAERAADIIKHESFKRDEGVAG